MRPRQEASPEQIEELREAMECDPKKTRHRRLLCVWLRIKRDMPTEAVASATGLCVSQVWRIWSRYFRGGLSAITKPKGGRRHECMTLEQEQKFLARHVAPAQKGRLLTARKIKQSFEREIGKKVPESTVCRMLARNKWRLISTRPTHPGGDPKARQAFKKNSAKGWLPPDAPSPA